MKQTFKKAERLCSKKIIEQLFAQGSSFAVHPIRIVWQECRLNTPFSVQVAISVPKKNIKKAVDRNNLKRKIREAYRKNKYLLYEKLEKNEKQMALMIIYTSKEILIYKEIEDKIILSLQRLMNEFLKKYSSTN